jgi:hypothetical protein
VFGIPTIQGGALTMTGNASVGGSLVCGQTLQGGSLERL